MNKKGGRVINDLRTDRLASFVENRYSEVEAGLQYDATSMAKSFGFLVPVFVFTNLWNTWLVPDEEALAKGESLPTRFRSVLDRLVYEIRVHRRVSKSNIIRFNVILTRRGRTENVDIISYLSATVPESSDPAITLLSPEDLVERS